MILKTLRLIARSFLALLPSSLVVPIAFGPARGYKWILGAHVYGCALGTYESRTQRVVTSFDLKGALAIDVGAQAGFYTILFSDLVGQDGRVLSFEPNPENSAKLNSHVLLNGLKNVETFGVALMHETGIVKFQFGENNAQGKVGDGFYSVFSTSLDELPNVLEISAERVFIKVDVEGGELEVLKGAEKFLNRNECIVLVSMHGDLELQSCLAFMRKINYAPHWASEFKSVYEISPLADVIFLRNPGVS